MIHFSLSSIIISILIGLVMIIILEVMINKAQVYKVLRADFLIVLSAIIFIRLILPVEFLNTISVPSRSLLPALYTFLNRDFFLWGHTLLLIEVLSFLWIGGTLIFLGKLIFNFLILNRIIQITKKRNNRPTYLSKDLRDTGIPVYISECVAVPTAIGIKGSCVLLPNINYSYSESKYILLHEFQHIKNRDILLKFFLEVLIAIYWWVFPLYLFRKQVALILEFRVDSQVTKCFSEEEYLEYTHALVKVQKKSISKVGMDTKVSVGFTNVEKKILNTRINFLLGGLENRKTPKFILMIAFILPFLATAVIFEPYSVDKSDVKGTYEPVHNKDTYLKKTKEGKFILYINGENLGQVDNLDDPALNDIKIVYEGE